MCCWWVRRRRISSRVRMAYAVLWESWVGCSEDEAL
jgi:hypothetical protein